MKTIKNQSPHRPKDMLVDIADKDYNAIIKTGEFISNDGSVKEVEIVEDIKKFPNISWTEKEILSWIQENHINIKYHPTKHTKVWILDELSKII